VSALPLSWSRPFWGEQQLMNAVMYYLDLVTLGTIADVGRITAKPDTGEAWT